MSTDPREFEHPIDGTTPNQLPTVLGVGSLTHEAIEAAARALCLLTYGVEWEHVSEAGRKPLREEARAALTAAYPLIEASAKAEALREAADDWRNMQRTDDHLLAQWLRARAATIESGAPNV